MAKNRVYPGGNQVTAAVISGVVSGDPVLIGQQPGVALTSRDANGKATVEFGGWWIVPVKGENNSGNVAVAVGDILYYEAGQTPPLNKDNVAGVRWGYAEDVITSGQTKSILVRCGY